MPKTHQGRGISGACLFQKQDLHHVIVQQRRLIYVEAQRLWRRDIQLIICYIRQSVPFLQQCRAH